MKETKTKKPRSGWVKRSSYTDLRIDLTSETMQAEKRWSETLEVLREDVNSKFKVLFSEKLIVEKERDKNTFSNRKLLPVAWS
jgi:hypothetical protein